MSKRELVLIKLASLLNGNRITWALGGSMMLYYLGYDIQVDDIDILVDSNSHEQLKKVLNPYHYTYINSDPKYQTEHFYQLTIDDIDIDIMINFKVKTKKGLYQFPFDKNHIRNSFKIKNEMIYLSDLEEWYRAYKAMNRIDKVTLIQEKNHFN